MNEIVYQLPEEVNLSKFLKEKAVCGAFLDVRLFGQHYYIPITKDIKKQFHLKEHKGNIIFTNGKEFQRLNNLIQDIINSIYLQVRDVVCAGIEESINQELKEGFSKLLENNIHQVVNKRINLRLENKNEKI